MNPGPPSNTLVARPPRWTWQAVVLALICTLGFLLALPILESLSRIAGPEQSLRRLQPKAMTAPPSTVPPPPIARPKPLPKPEEVPQLDEPARRIPVNALLDLDLDIGMPAADFSIQVDVLPAAVDLGSLVFELADLDQAPQATVRVNPVYPARARMRKIEGFVQLRFVIDAEGRTGEIEVVSSEPPGVFDQAAVRSVQRWKFQPGKRDGRAVATRVSQRLEFKMPR